MKIFETIEEVRNFSREKRSKNLKIGFVPTMGALHNGHLSLLDASVKKCDLSILSIFVNPKQFAPNEDFNSYPRDIEKDINLAKERGADAIFMPSIKDIYPIGYQTRVIVEKLEKPFEGKYRPHFFEGVATVCTKLFISVEPDEVFFGQKDYQQCLIIDRLIKDLNLAINFNMMPIAREPNGLAMSSRNQYLSLEEKEKAGIVFLTLEEARKQIAKGERRRKVINAIMLKKLKELNEIKIDYVGSAIADNLEEPEEFLKGDKIVLLIACFLNKTRLIDNMLVKI